MSKTKNVKLFISCAAILCCGVVSVLNPAKAKADETAFINLNGVALTQEQHSRLLRYFDEDTISTMSKTLLDSVKDNNSLKVVADQEKFIRQDTFFDKKGDVLSETETEIPAEEAYRSMTSVIRRSSSDNYSTSVKRIHLRVITEGGSKKVITLTNTWITMPVTKSYDVIAVRPVIHNSIGLGIINHFDESSISGYQKYNNGQVVTYSGKSDNVKISDVLTGEHGGVGISMNIPNSVSSGLSNSITVKLLTGADTVTVYGTYQHAKSAVSLSESKSYSFDSSGLGGVLKFNSTSIRNKYDGMTGVRVVYHEGDEFNEY